MVIKENDMYKVGQKLWLVINNSVCGFPSKQYEVTVTKSGKLWATLDNRMRCDGNGIVDGGKYSSPGRCYGSREEFEAIVALETSWREFQMLVNAYRNRPVSVSVENIAEAKRILGLF
jgi:hypothetical protein